MLASGKKSCRVPVHHVKMFKNWLQSLVLGVNDILSNSFETSGLLETPLLHQTSCTEQFHVYYQMFFTFLKTSPHLLQLFRTMLQRLFCCEAREMFNALEKKPSISRRVRK